jgi:phage tail tape-measure protein
VPPRGPDAAIGGRIGGAIGSFIGNAVPVIGNFIGSFVGSMLGTAIGGLFDQNIMNITGLTSLNELVFNCGWSSAEMNKGVTMACSRRKSTSHRMNSRVTLAYSRRCRSRPQIHKGLPRRGMPQPHIVNAPHTRLVHRQERQSACG